MTFRLSQIAFTQKRLYRILWP